MLILLLWINVIFNVMVIKNLTFSCYLTLLALFFVRVFYIFFNFHLINHKGNKFSLSNDQWFILIYLSNKILKCSCTYMFIIFQNAHELTFTYTLVLVVKEKNRCLIHISLKVPFIYLDWTQQKIIEVNLWWKRAFPLFTKASVLWQLMIDISTNAVADS